MKIKLLKDVLTPENGVGRVGQVIEVSQAVGHDYIKLGLAAEAAEGAAALPADPKPTTGKVITTETLKEDKGAKDRKTKTDGPAETK